MPKASVYRVISFSFEMHESVFLRIDISNPEPGSVAINVTGVSRKEHLIPFSSIAKAIAQRLEDACLASFLPRQLVAMKLWSPLERLKLRWQCWRILHSSAMFFTRSIPTLESAWISKPSIFHGTSVLCIRTECLFPSSFTRLTELQVYVGGSVASLAQDGKKFVSTTARI